MSTDIKISTANTVPIPISVFIPALFIISPIGAACVNIIFFILLSVVLALDPPTFIAQLMGISWGALAGAFLAPFLYGLYWKGVTKAAVWASFAAGIGITVTNMFWNYISSPINAGAIAMIAGLILVPLISIITPKMQKKEIDEIFSCYDESVTVKQKTALPAEEN